MLSHLKYLLRFKFLILKILNLLLHVYGKSPKKGLSQINLLKKKEDIMTSKDLSIFNSLRPFSIGFDDMFDQFESMLGNGHLTMQSNYPPYNIRKTGKDNYSIEVALAGFSKKDVEVEFEDNLLTVKTKQVNKSEDKNESGEIIHKGISQRQFARSFTIADDVRVGGAELKDGLLTIACERIVPEYKKKKLIEIK